MKHKTIYIIVLVSFACWISSVGLIRNIFVSQGMGRLSSAPTCLCTGSMDQNATKGQSLIFDACRVKSQQQVNIFSLNDFLFVKANYIVFLSSQKIQLNQDLIYWFSYLFPVDHVPKV